jgi:signal transduction histidine kinase
MTGILEYLVNIVSTGVNDPDFLTNTNAEIQTALYFTVLVLALIGVFCGIVVSRLALTPIRQAFNMQKRFISGIAHELRTPLSILRMNNEIASYETDASSRTGAVLRENIDDIDTISEILNNLLLLDRMISAEPLRFAEVDLASVIQTVIGRLSSLSEQKQVTLTTTEAVLPPIHGSKTAIEQVFFNILKNAISYTPAGGAVFITYIEKTDHTVRIRISDNGIGISAKDLPHIFEPFYRSEKTGKLSGTGIGLAIVSEIMKLHRGSISVESVEGQGTSFLLCFSTDPITKRPRARFPSFSFLKKDDE